MGTELLYLLGVLGFQIFDLFSQICILVQGLLDLRVRYIYSGDRRCDFARLFEKLSLELLDFLFLVFCHLRVVADLGLLLLALR
jgi:hypothetical protein